MKKRIFCIILTLILLLGLLPAGVFAADTSSDPESGGRYVLADSIEAGKSYVIVADGRYAMSNEEVPGKAAYSGSSTIPTTTPGEPPRTPPRWSIC